MGALSKVKRVKKGNEPVCLTNYRQNEPQESWDNFRNEKECYKAVVDRLRREQHGLCVYCEIDLKVGGDLGLSDLRVEHFHPKSISDDGFNWHLAWTNLLACCNGGSQRYVVDASARFSAPDLSCDAFKEQRLLDGVILDPLRITAFPRFFDCDRSTGELSVSSLITAREPLLGVQATNTINKLNLNSERLKRHRKTALDKLNNKLLDFSGRSIPIDEALKLLAKSMLVLNKDDEWPAFFTSIRSYLGVAAEEHLEEMAFDG